MPSEKREFAYFDGHNDALFRLLGAPSADHGHDFVYGNGAGDIDLVRAKSAQMVGGLFAVFALSKDRSLEALAANGQTIEAPMDMMEAREAFVAQANVFDQIVRTGGDEISHCLSGDDVDAALDAQKYAMVLHVEGAEAIDADLDYLNEMYAKGVRSIGPVWSRETIFGHGVPFAYPHSPDVGPGLTDAGKRLISACNALNIQVDLSHMNEKGFWDVAKLSDAPLVATHSNVHEICPSARNLTKKQLEAIGESGGMVGLNFATYFLRADGDVRADASFEDMLRHLDALLDVLGEDHVGLGSDFDGAKMPSALKNVSHVPDLFNAMIQHGYGADLVEKIASKNWINHLRRCLG